MSLFNRALQYNDQKKLYMALLGILERSERHELATDALRAMAKKFPGSCKVGPQHTGRALATLPTQDTASSITLLSMHF